MSAQAIKNHAPAQTELRRAFSLFPTGVVAVCALVDEQPAGIAVNSFNSVSLDPPLVSICVARISRTWPLLAGRTRLGLSVLGTDHGAVCRKLASRDGDRFAEVDWKASQAGAVHIGGAALWLECSVMETLEGGDHMIVLLEVLGSSLFPDVDPLVFHQSQFRELLTSA